MSGIEQALVRLQQRIWKGSLPLEIRLSPGESRTYDETDAYLVQIPRLSYLPFLLPRLHAFFRSSLIDPDATTAHGGWFSYENVPLKWHYPVGLLYDLYAGAEPASAEEDGPMSSMKISKIDWKTHVQGEESARSCEQNMSDIQRTAEDHEASSSTDTLPWSITVHFADWPSEHLPQLSSDGSVLLDAFRNSLKESSFTRHATNKPIFGLGYEDSTSLWTAVQQHDLTKFKPVNDKLLNPPGLQIKGIPLRLYLPHLPDASILPEDGEQTTEQAQASAGTLRVVQAPVTPLLGGRSSTQQTLGTALNALLPSLFPSRRSPLLALPVLHGAVVPLSAGLEELSRAASYADGWLHITIKMML